MKKKDFCTCFFSFEVQAHFIPSTHLIITFYTTFCVFANTLCIVISNCVTRRWHSKPDKICKTKDLLILRSLPFLNELLLDLMNTEINLKIDFFIVLFC